MKYKELSTERLQLRNLQVDDAYNILFLRSDDVVNQFVERQNTKTIDDALKFIKHIQLSVSKHKVYYWSICLKSKPSLIGTICLWNFSEDRKKAEVGYDLHPKFHGKGIMSETLNAVLEFAFDELNLTSIEAYTQHDNSASLYLLKKKKFSLMDSRVDKDNPKNGIFVLTEECYRAS